MIDPRSLFAPVQTSPKSVISGSSLLGYPKEARLKAAMTGEAEPGPTVWVGDRCMIFNHVVLYEGVQLGEDCVLEDRVRIGYESMIGPRTRVMYGAFVCDQVQVGSDCRIAGFVCDGASIGARCTVMGDLVHEYTQPHRDWWEVDETPPRIESDSVVAFGARIVGGVIVGPRSYVAAGAVITRDVPSGHVATGINQLTPVTRWRGRRLQGLIAHWLRE